MVDNPDKVPLPFGLGYHPYFRVPHNSADAIADACARSLWEATDGLPTGQRVPVDAARDLRKGQPYASLHLDDYFTDLEPTPAADGLVRVGGVRQSGWRLDLLVSPDFRELVAFTPPHREAIAIEPYTCAADAINLQTRGIDAGLRVLARGESWRGTVRLAVRRTL